MTAQTDFNLTAHAGGSTLSYAADFWDTIRAQWAAQSKLDPSTWTNPPTGAKRITSPAVGQFVLEQNTGTPAAPVWTTRFTFDSTANTTAITAASNAAAAAQANAYKTNAGKTFTLVTNTNLQSWAENEPPSGVYDVTLTAAQNGLPQGSWYVDVKTTQLSNVFNKYHYLEASSTSVSGLFFRNICENNTWTGWKEVWTAFSQRYASIYFATNISSSFVKLVNFSTFSNDGNFLYANNRYVVNKSGLYSISVDGDASWIAPSTGSHQMTFAIYVNGGNYKQIDSSQYVVSGEIINRQARLSFIKNFVAGDYIEVFASQNMGTMAGHAYLNIQNIPS